MSRYIIRLDDACPRRNIEAWDRMEALLDQYGVKPLVGVIPDCQDPAMDKYPADEKFWARVQGWQDKGWCIAMHGYDHVYRSTSGGINPMQARSEFAGLPLDVQRQKIAGGVEILRSHGIEPRVFFAPSHTFDKLTLQALKECSDIRIISDTFAADVYGSEGFTFVPQQSGLARELPFPTTCFCYHPNDMSQAQFESLEDFLRRHAESFIPFPTEESGRKLRLYEALMRKAYFGARNLKKILRER